MANSLTLLLLVDGVLVLPRDLNELGILHDELLLEVAVRAHELDRRGRVLSAERGELDVAGGGGGEHGGGVEGECELVACVACRGRGEGGAVGDWGDLSPVVVARAVELQR